MIEKEQITEWFLSLQNNICDTLENEDEKGKFIEDDWIREDGGGGRTRIIQNGNVIEKGGVLFSKVFGKLPQNIGDEYIISSDNKLTIPNFFATGVSIVIHPVSPFVPIIHMNVRYFEMDNGTWWFGGGIDLTPHYVNEEDATLFHNALQTACNKHNKTYYSDYKKQADNYFYIPHRKETRGIGGIFFDKLTESDTITKGQLFDFVKDVGNAFAPVYTTLMNKNKSKSFTKENKHWQFLRRGRYVEFNLVYDRGTKFGLETNGRTESILMSLPETASWAYNYVPPTGSEEEKTLSFLKKGIDWVK